MEIEKTQHVGHYGVVFSVIHFTAHHEDRERLKKLALSELNIHHYRVADLVVEMYDRVLAQDRPCRMMLAVSRPISRSTADLLNDQRVKVGAVISTISAHAVAPVVGGLAAGATGMIAGSVFKGKLPTYHAGDIVVSVDAQVSGGIGPQRSSQAMILKVNEGR